MNKPDYVYLQCTVNCHHMILCMDRHTFHCYMQELEDTLSLWYTQDDNWELFQCNQKHMNKLDNFQYFDKLNMHHMEMECKDLFEGLQFLKKIFIIFMTFIALFRSFDYISLRSTKHCMNGSPV